MTTNARRDLKSLKQCRGFLVLGQSGRGEATFVRIETIEGYCFYRRLPGYGAGLNALFEMEYVRGGDE